MAKNARVKANEIIGKRAIVEQTKKLLDFQ
jgi:hypothetical protein